MLLVIVTNLLVLFSGENATLSPASSPKKVGDENRQNRLILGDSGDEESDRGFETFMPHRFFYYKSRILKCQYRQQGGSVPF